MKQIKTANVMACEYVALGSNRKQTLINCYTGDVIVARFPATIPISFYIEILPEPEMSALKLDVLQNKKKVAEIEAEFEYEAGKIGLIVIPQLPFKIEKEATIRVIASCQGFRTTTVISKKVKVGPMPSGG